MPLMIDASGYPVYAGTPIYQTASATAVSVFSTKTLDATATAIAAAVTNHVETQAHIINEHKAIQEALDSETPRNLMLTGLGLVVLVAILAHPRFLARLMASIHRTKHSSGHESPPCSATPLQHKVRLPIGGGDLRSGWLLKGGKTGVTLDPTLTPPPHITPLQQHLPFSSVLLFAPFAWLPRWLSCRASLSEVCIIAAYLVVVAFALIWRSDVTPTTDTKGYGYDFNRTGLTAMVHIPWAVALGVRGNIVGLCVGKGYERLKRLHKIVGRVLFLAATLHTLFWIQKFAAAGVMASSMTKPMVIAGLAAWVGIIVIAVTSLPQVRNSCYSLFKGCHILGMLMLLVGMCYHIDVAIPWCVASLAIYGFSIVCSIAKTRLAHADLVALSSDTTIVTIPALRSGWRAGQHVRIRIPALGRSGFEAHPFTIASAPDTEGLVLMCKVAGDWTRRLHDFASVTKTTTIVLEGPFGGLGNTLLPSFSGVVVTAGGSGISHALSLSHDLLARAPSGAVRARAVDLVWTIPTEDIAKPLMPTLIDMVEDARAFESTCLEGRKMHQSMPSPVAFRVHIHVTRCPASSPITLELKRLSNPFLHPLEKPSYYTCLSGINVLRNRPDFASILHGVADEVIDQGKRERTQPSGICVTACGPGSMVDSVRNAARGLGRKTRDAGGVDYEEEYFEL